MRHTPLPKLAILILAGCCLLITACKPGQDRAAKVAPHASTATTKVAVQIYGTEWCGHCQHAREYMAEHKIAFSDHDVEKEPAAQEKFRELDGRGVPLIVVGDQVLHGFSEESFEQAWQNQNSPST